jgi:hypothetical protein
MEAVHGARGPVDHRDVPPSKIRDEYALADNEREMRHHADADRGDRAA